MTQEKQKPVIAKLWGRRAALVAIELALVVVVLGALGVGALLWRLRSGPMDIGFAKEFIESALHDKGRGMSMTMDRLVLTWPDMRQPVQFGLYDVKIISAASQKPLLAVNEAALSLSKTALLIGRVAPVSLTLKKPALRIIRNQQGVFDLGFAPREDIASKAVEEQADDQTQLTARILQYIAKPGGVKGETSPLAALRSFEIEEARVVIEDHQLGITWFLPRMDASFNSTRQGLEAGVYVKLPGHGQAGAESDVSARLVYEWGQEDMDLSMQIKNFDARVVAGKIPELSMLRQQDFIFDSQVEAKLGPDLLPRAAKLLFLSAQGSVNIPQLSGEEPVAYENLAVEASYDAAQKTLAVSQAQVTANGVTIKGAANLVGDEKGFTGPVSVAINELAQEKIAPLWPAALKGDSSEEWIVEKLSEGTFYDLAAQLTLVAAKGEQGWDFDAKDIEAGFTFENMSVDYRPPMIPASKAKGKGRFDYDTETLSIDIESAMIGDLAVKEAQLKFVDIIKVGAGQADIDVKVEGPLKTVIDYISREPIELKHTFDIKRIEGSIAAAVNVKFPTAGDIKIEDVKVDVDATASKVVLPNVVKTLELTGGPYKIAVKDNALNVKGEGMLSGRPGSFEYSEFMDSAGKAYKNQAKASLNVDPELRTYFGLELEDFIEGSAFVNLTYTEYGGGKSQADISADLTQTHAFFKPFDYDKPAGVKGTATLRAVLQNGVPVQVQDLKITGPKLQLDSTTLVFTPRGEEPVLTSGKISHFAIGETVGSAEFQIDSAGVMKVALSAPFLDLRPFLNNDGNKEQVYDDPPMQISVAADQMRAAENETLQYGKIFVDIDKEGRFNQLEMDATAGGKDVYLRFKPDETGRRVFRFEADDAGATLRAFGLYDNVVGGKMIAYAEPIKGVYDRNLVGTAEIQNFKVVRAPALARLLGALSLPGLMNLLGDEGITFTKMEAKFDWLYRPQGSIMVLKDGATSGNSLGLTFEGTFDKAAGNVDVSGTLVPLSGVNKIIGDIPLIGDILTGGSGGVFAATYTIKGKAEQPEIFVNPLSILTPGILRRILFE